MSADFLEKMRIFAIYGYAFLTPKGISLYLNYIFLTIPI